MTNIAVILAGGIGARVGGQTPKQLLPLDDGQSILEHAVYAFETAAAIDGIILVMHADYMAEAQALVQKNDWHKVLSIVPGGKERWESSWKAIEAACAAFDGNWQSTNLLLHDAARPFVSERIIADVCKALDKYKAVCVAIPSTDTLLETDDSGEFIAAVPNRNHYRRVQTPQGFRLETIVRAYQKGLQDPHFAATDDCGVVLHYLPQEPIYIVDGEEQNRKITYKEDLATTKE